MLWVLARTSVLLILMRSALLQEMQWIHSSAIHSGEYFHGPFEITDKDVPFIMMMSTGRTRALDQRALDFLHRFGEKIMVLDNEEMGLNALDSNVAEFFNQIFTAALLDMFYMDLCEVRKHPASYQKIHVETEILILVSAIFQVHTEMRNRAPKALCFLVF